jgi:hypothetical protein
MGIKPLRAAMRACGAGSFQIERCSAASLRGLFTRAVRQEIQWKKYRLATANRKGLRNGI